MQLSEKYSNNPALICAFEPDLFSPPAAVNFDERGCKDAGADALALMTAHREFRELDLRRVKERMRTPIMIDGRRVFKAEGVRGLGLVYRGVGE
ncbi:MAG: hypothetical protein KKD69_08660 [Euryarchaeota archaeon]|nr:hypothetical protein [Euryarchaeota archaeon]MCG2713122.1 UDP binding domain-containing protein [Candidatus Omnitrophota bacterium]